MKPCIARLFSCTPVRLIVSTDGQNFLRALRCTNFWRSASQLLTLPACRALSESEAGDDLPRINDSEYYGGYEKW